MTNFEAESTEFARLLLEEDFDDAANWTKQQLESGVTALEFFDGVFTPAMTGIGEKFGRLDIFLPELMDAAEKAKAISEAVIQPMLSSQNSGVSTVRGKVVLCSVKGDLHDIGKNMVRLMLQVNGFDVIDLGIMCSRCDKSRREEGADIIGLSSLMTINAIYERMLS
jgi:methanogenic corrinoid protein MtbC1